MLIPGGFDWYEVFYPTTNLLLNGRSPYDGPGFYSPVWALLPFLPLAFLPASIGRSILFIISLLAFTYSARKLGAGPWMIAAFLLSPPVVFSLWLASNDWMPLLGFVLPPQMGLFFVLSKPQMGVAVALFWLVEAWRDGGVKKIIRVFAPVTLAFLLTIVIYGLWPLKTRDLIIAEHNTSFWPASIPVALGLLIASIRKRDLNYSIVASPCLSPYLMFPSWSGALAALLSTPPEAIAAIIGTWILVIIQAYS